MIKFQAAHLQLRKWLGVLNPKVTKSHSPSLRNPWIVAFLCTILYFNLPYKTILGFSLNWINIYISNLFEFSVPREAWFVSFSTIFTKVLWKLINSDKAYKLIRWKDNFIRKCWVIANKGNSYIILIVWWIQKEITFLYLSIHFKDFYMKRRTTHHYVMFCRLFCANFLKKCSEMFWPVWPI